MICVACQDREAQTENEVFLFELERLFGVKVDTDEEKVYLCDECFRLFNELKTASFMYEA